MAKKKQLAGVGTALAVLPQNTIPNVMNGIFVVAAAGGTYLLAKKIINDAKRAAALKDYGNPNTTAGKAATYATQMYKGIILTYEWLNDTAGDGTNLTLIYATAKEMYTNRIPFPEVAGKYQSLYNRDLLSDLQRDLNGSEMQKFNSILNGGLAGLGTLPASTQAARAILTKAPAYVLDEKYAPINPVLTGTLLGTHIESVLLPHNRILHGFVYQGNLRYIDAQYTNLIPNPNVPA